MPRPASRLDRWEAATRAHVPGPLAFLVFGELRLFEAIWQLVSRRHDIREGEVGIGYARGRLPVELVFAGLAVVELIAVDLLVPWDRLGSFAWLRMVVLLASVYGLVWIVLWMVAEADRLTHDIPLQGTNLDINLHEPLDARIPFRRRSRQVMGISLGVDDPAAALAAIRPQLASIPPQENCR